MYFCETLVEPENIRQSFSLIEFEPENIRQSFSLIEFEPENIRQDFFLIIYLILDFIIVLHYNILYSGV